MSRKRLLVMKFGGTSVGNSDRFRQCAEIVGRAARNDRVIVVVSAVAGVTDLIFRTLDAAKRGDSVATEANLKQFEFIHQKLVAELFHLQPNRSVAVLEFVSRVVEQLRNSSRALLALHSDVSAQTHDLLAALGERISACLLANTIEQAGGSCEFVRAEDVIITDNNFGHAAPDMESTAAACNALLVPILERSAVPVVGGYSGATKDGQPTTLGRGGSDYSATILGAAAGADEVWIWTDVDGVLSADPRICPDATTLPEISFAEAIELAYYGAKVIHPKAAYPAMDAGIPVWIKNSFRPENPGTKITRAAVPINSPVKAVTCVNSATLITLVTGREVHSAELFGRLFLRLGQEKIDTLFATQSSPEHALGLVLRKEDGIRVLKLIQAIFRIELTQGVLNPVAVQNDIGVITVLGESMRGTPGILGRVFSGVARQNVSVIAVAQGASELSICFAVPSVNCPDVVRAIHEEFCSPGDFAAVAACVQPGNPVGSELR
ncbi:MAG TPA: aspartate kinase [Candidatus Angelobacter sp.]|nr:aspartate kinase [Candidatus Angelobacter sp.]